MKLSTKSPLYILLFAIEFQLISIIDDVMAAILNEKTRALSRPQFSSDFHEIWFKKYDV